MMWIYRAYDEYGLPIAEAYSRGRLIEKLIDELGAEALEKITIERIFDKTLN